MKKISAFPCLMFWAICILMLSEDYGSAQPSGSPTNGLVSYYSFSGNADDSVGGNNGIVFGASLTADRFNNPNSAYFFNGIDSRIVAAPVVSWFSGNASRSISIWLDARSMQGNLFSFGSREFNQRFSVLLGWGGPEATAFVPEGDNANFTSGNFADTGWRNLTLTWDNGLGSFYIDGQKQVEFNRTVDTDGAQPLIIGASPEPFADEFFFGSLDDVSVYNRALSSLEVTELYNAQSVPEPSTYALLLLSGAASLWALKRRRS